jgi:hypothetical protein
MPDKDTEVRGGCEEHERGERVYSPRAHPDDVEGTFYEVRYEDPLGEIRRWVKIGHPSVP